MFEISGIEELNKSIYINKNKLIMLYFGASWCGPCKKLKLKLHDPTEIEEISNMHVCYLDIDNESNRELVEMYNVESLPTIYFIKLNEENEVDILHTIIGYDWVGIKFAYNKFNV
jgi:thiol:disulfide interchange protein